MTLYTIASKFEKKIILTASNTFQNIEKVYRDINNLIQQKNTFSLGSNKNLIDQLLNTLNNTVKIYYLNSRDYGISASQHASYLHQLIENLEQLLQVGSLAVNANLSAQLNNIRNSLFNIVPIALAPQRRTTVNNTIPTVNNQSNPSNQSEQERAEAMERVRQLSEEFGKPIVPPKDFQEMQEKMRREQPNAFPPAPPTDEELSNAIPRPQPLPWNMAG